MLPGPNNDAGTPGDIIFRFEVTFDQPGRACSRTAPATGTQLIDIIAILWARQIRPPFRFLVELFVRPPRAWLESHPLACI